MKSANMTRMTFMALMAALSGMPAAYAGVNNHPGSVCQPDIPSDSANINYDGNGTVANNGAEPISVICPLVRSNTNSDGATVYVDVNHAFDATTSCSVSSFGYSGSFLGSAVGSFSGAGFHEIALNIKGQGKSDYWSRYTVKCTIPANKAGRILGVILAD